VRDLSVYNINGTNDTGAGIDVIGGGLITIERVFLYGHRYAAILDGCNSVVMRGCAYGAGGTGYGWQDAKSAVGVWIANGLRHGRGNTASQATNNVLIECGQFNGPMTNVWHDDGVGHTVRHCNSEGGTLARMTSCDHVLHERWTREGAYDQLFHFDDQGNVAEQFVAQNICVRDCQLGTGAAPFVRVAARAAAAHFFWWNNLGDTLDRSVVYFEDLASLEGILVVGGPYGSLRNPSTRFFSKTPPSSVTFLGDTP
jgi:hypothetical protein